VDPVPDPLLLRKTGSARNLTLDLWICSQKLYHWTTEAMLHDIYTNVFEQSLKE
jgi:hypothetical protein